DVLPTRVALRELGDQRQAARGLAVQLDDVTQVLDEGGPRRHAIGWKIHGGGRFRAHAHRGRPDRSVDGLIDRQGVRYATGPQPQAITHDLDNVAIYAENTPGQDVIVPHEAGGEQVAGAAVDVLRRAD